MVKEINVPKTKLNKIVLIQKKNDQFDDSFYCIYELYFSILIEGHRLKRFSFTPEIVVIIQSRKKLLQILEVFLPLLRISCSMLDLTIIVSEAFK